MKIAFETKGFLEWLINIQKDLRIALKYIKNLRSALNMKRTRKLLFITKGTLEFFTLKGLIACKYKLDVEISFIF